MGTFAHQVKPAQSNSAKQALRQRLGIQGQLTVRPPADRYEQEADRVAREVLQPTASDVPPPRIERLRHEEDDHLTAQAQDAESISAAQPARTEAAVRSLEAGGEPLPQTLRSRFEPRFGHSFEHVRIHADSRAAGAARDLDALAYTRGRHIVFGQGQFEPHTERGQRLLAHELTHVVQQGCAGQDRIQRSYLAPVPDTWARREVRIPPVTPPTDEDENVTIQRQPAPGSGSGSQQAPATASPTIALAPGGTLVRGDTLTASVAFAPSAGEKLTVTGWQFTTAAGEVVTRPKREPKFQSEWKGVMALPGTLELTYTVKPRGKPAAAGAPVTATVAVSDRTGADWQTTVTNVAETALTGVPSPPEKASELGHHVVPGDLPAAAADQPIRGGPNSGFTYVSQVTDRTFKSEGKIHPDVTNAASRFRVFHRAAGLLFWAPNGGTRILIPATEFSDLKVANGNITFNVPDWTAFFKKHRVLSVTVTAGRTTVPAQDSWWRLDPNTERGSVRITNEGAVRFALGIGPKDSFTSGITVNGGWQAVALMPSDRIPQGTRSHEFAHPRQSHRANFHAIVRALDPRRLLESTVSTPANQVVFRDKISFLLDEIDKPNHELVDEAASKAAGRFVAVAGATMAAVNQDPSTRASLGDIWDLTHDRPLPP